MNILIFSFLFDPSTFFGFYFAGLIGFCVTSFCSYNGILSAIIHIGLCSYINAMVKDLENSITKLNFVIDLQSNTRNQHEHRSCKTDIWREYVEAIDFHNKIFE